LGKNGLRLLHYKTTYFAIHRVVSKLNFAINQRQDVIIIRLMAVLVWTADVANEACAVVETMPSFIRHEDSVEDEQTTSYSFPGP
jgi:hypothetical protein